MKKPPEPPYGAPQGYPPNNYQQQPPYPQQQYGAPPGPPPQGHYHQHPPQQGPYGQAPPQQQGGYYGAPSPQPPAGYHQNPSPQPGYGPPPPVQSPYGQGPPQGYGPPPGGNNAPGFAPPGAHGAPPYGGPVMPTLGYTPGQVAPGDFRREADILRKAMKGFGTDESALIQVLARQDPLQMAAVRATYSQHIGRDLYKDVKSETGGYLRQGLLAVIEGPLVHDVECARESIDGIGTKEWLMNDVLLGRSNADLNAIKMAYERKYHRHLARDVEGDLSMKTAVLFKRVLEARRHEESMPCNPQDIGAKAAAVHAKRKDQAMDILVAASDAELRAIDHEMGARYRASLENVILKEYSGHMEKAYVQMVRTATDPAMRDAILLEECMAGMGTKDEALVTRIVRLHWNRDHKEQVKRAYHHRFKKDLIQRVRGETSGDYQRLMVALLE
ncbi:hypothetical protein N7466_007598 [Penicillium verhagenii]|uniref:uncharacterized protein n=1 Tax=Penicillium verhagenii TaxID=1562060 RepID=UPI002544FDF5|nr:uncharacterized protein N7466_007598 [Penicillium verhagenii]KAJ5928642.1 hypothetical protein N7466_007598 [Penicillium verhagenii]